MQKLSIIFLLLCQVLFSQAEKYVPDLNIKTPEVSSLLKYIETPVSYNSGLVNFNVPIYQIRQGDLTYPISIDYNSEGVRVNERADWVGTGFSISQPQITRSVKGLADDHGGFIYENEYKIDNITETVNVGEVNSGNQPTNYLDASYQFYGGLRDFESDDYRIILPNGEAVRFFFSQDRTTEFPYGKIIQLPITNYLIRPLFNNNYINGWQITGSDGTIYLFGNGNNTISNQSYGVTTSSLASGGSKSSGYTTSWMLHKITSPKNNVLQFNYESHYFEDCNFTGQSRLIDITGSEFTFQNEVSTNYQKNRGFNFLLKSIEGAFGKVEFNIALQIREDYSYGKILDNIRVLNSENELIEKFSLDYFYKLSTAPTQPIYSCMMLHPSSDLIKRLFLNKITILGKNENQTTNMNSYKFEYNQGNLPHRFSFAVDWWGRYNDKSNNVIVPTAQNNDTARPNRSVDPMHTQAGILNKVTFPTGGFTMFEFENNRGILQKNVLTWTQGTVFQTKIDEINIVPSLVNEINKNTNDLIPISVITNTNGTTKKFQFQFQLQDNIIGFYSPGLEVPNIGFLVNFDVNCTSCNVVGGSIPQQGDCYVKYKIYKGSNLLYNKFVANDKVDLEFEVGNNDMIFPQNYIVEIETFSGNPNLQNHFSELDNVNFKLNWQVYNPALVNKIGNFYDIPLGGLRIKNIKTYDKLGVLSLSKFYDYKNDQGIESGIFNFNPANTRFSSNRFYISSETKFPLNSYGGRSIGYNKVTESFASPTTSYKNIYKYNFFDNPQNINNCYLYQNSFGWGMFPCIDDPNNGVLIEKLTGSEKTENFAYQNVFPNTQTPRIKGIAFGQTVTMQDNSEISTSSLQETKYEIATFYPHKLVETIEKVNTTANNNFIETISKNQYNGIAHQQVTMQTTYNSTGETLDTKYYYPQDPLMSNEPTVPDLIAKNMIAMPLKIETIRNGQQQSEQITKFAKDVSTSNLILPKFIFTKKGNGISEIKITYNQYDNKGNIQQYTPENGIPVSIVWGYNQTLPIAKLENVAYASLAPYIANLQTASNAAGNETALLIALNNLRAAFPNAMITTYTHKPLIGVSTITDPKGDKIQYFYDAFSRLDYVLDKNGNKLSENKYNYKP